MKEFFGIGGYQRTPEGFLSWQHILFVSCFMVAMVALAIYFGRKFRDRSEEAEKADKIMPMSIRGTDSFAPIFVIGTIAFLTFKGA